MNTAQREVNGITTHFHLWGESSKPIVFFVHGWMDVGASFEFICRQLAKHYYCVAPDLRGFGKTDHVPFGKAYYFFDYLNDLYHYIEQFSKGQPVHLVGHSMGANIVSLYAGVFPEQVESLILLEGIGPQGAGPETLGKRLRTWIENNSPRGFQNYADVNDIAKRLQRANPNLPKERAEFLAPHVAHKTPKGYTFDFDPLHKGIHPYVVPLEQYYAVWSQISARVLVVAAEQTNLGRWFSGSSQAQEEFQRRLQYLPKNTQFHQIPGCGHMLHHEAPEAVAGLIEDFLQTSK